ncbi:MAG: type II toxin-antitoxin system VapC family toxin [Promethearchaeia archaeon]
MIQLKNNITLDSSIIISILKKDKFSTNIYKIIKLLRKLEFNVFISHITYAEIWTGVIKSKTPKKDEQKVNKTLYELFRVKIMNLNITIAQIAAEAFLKYKSFGGKRDHLIPDFLIGAHAKYYSDKILTTNPRDFLKYIQDLEVLTPELFLKQYS